MDIVTIMVVLFLIVAIFCIIATIFGPPNIPPKLIQVAWIIAFVVLVILVLHYLGFVPNLRLK